jgi:hypothetical protein
LILAAGATQGSIGAGIHDGLHNGGIVSWPMSRVWLIQAPPRNPERRLANQNWLARHDQGVQEIES